MNKGFKKYFRESYKKSFKLLKKTNNYFKYLIFTIMNCISNLILPLKPVTDMASVRMAKNIKEGKDVCITNSMVVAEKPKSYWNYVLINGLKALIFAAIGLTIVLIGGLLALTGYSLTLLVDADSFALAIILALPAIVGLIIYLIIMPYLSVPAAYLVDTYPNVGVSKQLYSSFESLKKGGKKTLFVNDLVHSLLILASILPLLIILIVCLVLEVNLGITLLVGLLMVLAMLYFYPRFILSNQLVKLSLLEDIVLDDKTLQQKFIGIDFDKFNSKEASLEAKLLNIFDSEKNLNLEAKLFQNIPSVNIQEKKVVVKEPAEEELKPIDFAAFKKEEDVKVVESVVKVETPVVEEVKEETPVIEDTLVEEVSVLEETAAIEEPVVVEEVSTEEVALDKDEELDDIYEELDDIFLDSEGE